jgi:tetratricopeptide (TPR) repeat protein
MNPKVDIQEDLETAIQFDPNLLDAYLEHTALLLQQGSVELALEELNSIERLAPQSPFFYLYRARANLLLNKDASALEDALEAYQLDQTLLPAYLTLGQAYQKNHSPGKARNFLETYLRYETENPLHGLPLVRRCSAGRMSVPVTAFDRALERDFPLICEAAMSIRGAINVNDFFLSERLAGSFG